MGEGAERALESLQSAWRPLQDAVAGLADADWERTTAAGWTVKEMLAHLAFWEEAAVPVITYMLRGQEIPKQEWFGSGFTAPEDRDWPPAYEHNAREATWGREHSVEEVRARLVAAHSAAIGAVATITDEEAPRDALFLKEHTDHYREHHAELKAALET